MSKMNKRTRDIIILFRKLNVNTRKRAQSVESGYPQRLKRGVICGVGQRTIADFKFFGTIYLIFKPYIYVSLLSIKFI